MRYTFNRIIALSCFIVLAPGCVISNNSSVSIDDYTHVEGTPIYILSNPPLDSQALKKDILSCIDKTDTKVKITNRILKTTGGLTAATGIAALVSITATGGFLAPLFIPAYATLAAVGGGLYLSASATEQFREYTGLEKCLEKQGYEVVFITTAIKPQQK